METTSNSTDSFDRIQDGDNIYIIFDPKRKWLVTVKSGKQFHSHKGFFNYDDIIGKKFGTIVLTNKSTKLAILRPIPIDYLRQISHSSQIIYEKDAGAILLYGGIFPGAKVIETGTGSGALTAIIANFVKPHGQVYTYENRENAYLTASKNIALLGLNEYVSLKNKDALEGYDESDVDSVVLDLGDPCLLIEQAYIALKPSGVMSIFVPTYNQVERVYHELLKYPFIEIKAIELIEREIQLKDNAIRPKTWMMVGHTGFLIFARKLQTDKESVKHSQKEEIGENESS